MDSLITAAARALALWVTPPVPGFTTTLLLPRSPAD
jgi:hypothetical protein